MSRYYASAMLATPAPFPELIYIAAAIMASRLRHASSLLARAARIDMDGRHSHAFAAITAIEPE